METAYNNCGDTVSALTVSKKQKNHSLMGDLVRRAAHSNPIFAIKMAFERQK